MTAYVVAAMTFTDENRYRVYQSALARVFARFGGRLLAADEAPVSLEGAAPDKVVIMGFDDEGAALRFLTSAAYQAISGDRQAGATGQAVLVRGLPGIAP